MSSNDDAEYARCPRTERRNDWQYDDPIKGIKLKIPACQGKIDLESWCEGKIDMIFDCHKYIEEHKVKLANVEFTNYAVVWWD